MAAEKEAKLKERLHEKELEAHASRVTGVLDPLVEDISKFNDDNDLTAKIRDTYLMLDENESGGLDFFEFRDGVKKLPTAIPIHVMKDDWDVITQDGAFCNELGEFSCDQFQQVMRGELQRFAQRQITNAMIETESSEMKSVMLMLKMIDNALSTHIQQVKLHGQQRSAHDAFVNNRGLHSQGARHSATGRRAQPLHNSIQQMPEMKGNHQKLEKEIQEMKEQMTSMNNSIQQILAVLSLDREGIRPWGGSGAVKGDAVAVHGGNGDARMSGRALRLSSVSGVNGAADSEPPSRDAPRATWQDAIPLPPSGDAPSIHARSMSLQTSTATGTVAITAGSPPDTQAPVPGFSPHQASKFVTSVDSELNSKTVPVISARSSAGVLLTSFVAVPRKPQTS